jgi:hypothetical protein
MYRSRSRSGRLGKASIPFSPRDLLHIISSPCSSHKFCDCSTFIPSISASMSVTSEELEILSSKAIDAKRSAYCMSSLPTLLYDRSPCVYLLIGSICYICLGFITWWFVGYRSCCGKGWVDPAGSLPEGLTFGDTVCTLAIFVSPNGSVFGMIYIFQNFSPFSSPYTSISPHARATVYRPSSLLPRFIDSDPKAKSNPLILLLTQVHTATSESVRVFSRRRGRTTLVPISRMRRILSVSALRGARLLLRS